MLAGAALVLTCLFDAWNWLLGHTPPPRRWKPWVSPEGWCWGFRSSSDWREAPFLFRIGLLWLEEDGSRRACTACGRSARSSGIWMRLARYEMSYVSAIDVYRSFYDFVMLIFIMLFFLFFARFAAGVGNPRPRLLVGVSLSAALCALTGPATHFIMFAMGNPDAAEACALATPGGFLHRAVRARLRLCPGLWPALCPAAGGARARPAGRTGKG